MCSGRWRNSRSARRPNIFPRMRRPKCCSRLRDHLGFSRNVIVQASCHGTDNAGDARRHRPVRGQGARRRGGRSVDFRHGAAAPRRRRDPRRPLQLPQAARRRRAQGAGSSMSPGGSSRWAGTSSSISRRTFSTNCALSSTPSRPSSSIDHIARPDVAQGPDGSGHQGLQRLLDEHPNIWTKVTGAERLSPMGYPFDDFVEVVRPLVEAYPDRVLWGTDWPHPNMEHRIPDDGAAGRRHPAHRPDRGTSAQAARRQSRAALLEIEPLGGVKA